MFERYTEKARRVIFFARYEASQNGSPYIDPMHLLLGILHESTTLFSDAGLQVSVSQLAEDCRKALPPPRPVIPTNVDLPLSNECRQALEDASAEADRLGSETIGWQHLMLGLIKASDHVSRLLQRHGITGETMAAIAPAKQESSGIAVASVRSGQATVFVEFLCQGERIGSTRTLFGHPLPRPSDEVVFGSRAYKVLSVRFHFEEAPTSRTTGHDWLAKVVVETERVKPV